MIPASDQIAETALLEVSRTQRRAFETAWSRRYHEYDLLLTAGVDADEAERIVRRTAADRAAITQKGFGSMNTAANALIEHEPTQARREVVTAPSVSVTPMDMIDRALSSNATPETLERLLALQERWEASQARKAFDEAMAAAKAEIPVISKNRTVDFTSSKGRTHYKHEDLAEIARTVNPILGRHGLSYRFRTSSAASRRTGERDVHRLAPPRLFRGKHARRSTRR
jgi:hypothetical protein